MVDSEDEQDLVDVKGQALKTDEVEEWLEERVRSCKVEWIAHVADRNGELGPGIPKASRSEITWSIKQYSTADGRGDQ